MLLTPKDEKEDNDFFESDEEIPEVRVKRPKKPSYRRTIQIIGIRKNRNGSI